MRTNNKFTAALRHLLKISAVLVMVLLLGTAGTARAADNIYWNGGTGYWDQNSMWDANRPPSGDEHARISLDGSDVTIRTAADDIKGLYLDAAGTQTLRIQDDIEAWWGQIGRNGGTGVVYQTAGTANFNRPDQPRQTLILGDGSATTGIYDISGGSMHSAGFLDIGQNGATGLFRVHGTGPAQLQDDRHFRLYPKGTYEALIDSAGVTAMTIAGNATFDAGSTLKLGFDTGTTPYNGTWTILDIDDNVSGSPTLDAPGGWSMGWDDTSVQGRTLLTGTYAGATAVIPEPSTFAIWSLGLLGLAWVARRRTSRNTKAALVTNLGACARKQGRETMR